MVRESWSYPVGAYPGAWLYRQLRRMTLPGETRPGPFRPFFRPATPVTKPVTKHPRTVFSPSFSATQGHQDSPVTRTVLRAYRLASASFPESGVSGVLMVLTVVYLIQIQKIPLARAHREMYEAHFSINYLYI